MSTIGELYKESPKMETLDLGGGARALTYNGQLRVVEPAKPEQPESYFEDAGKAQAAIKAAGLNETHTAVPAGPGKWVVRQKAQTQGWNPFAGAAPSSPAPTPTPTPVTPKDFSF
jgi:hypothetical protein